MRAILKSKYLILLLVLCARIKCYTCAIDWETETEHVDFKQFFIYHDLVEISKSEYIYCGHQTTPRTRALCLRVYSQEQQQNVGILNEQFWYM